MLLTWTVDDQANRVHLNRLEFKMVRILACC